MKVSLCNGINKFSFGMKPIMRCSLKNSASAVVCEVENTNEDNKYIKNLCDKYQDRFFFLSNKDSFDLTKNKVYVLKDSDDETLAYATCQKAGVAMEINYLSTRTDCKRQGAGQALLAGIAKNALDNKMQSIIINNPDDAWKFYYKCGFRTVDDVTELNAVPVYGADKTLYDLINKVNE